MLELVLLIATFSFKMRACRTLFCGTTSKLLCSGIGITLKITLVWFRLMTGYHSLCLIHILENQSPYSSYLYRLCPPGNHPIIGDSRCGVVSCCGIIIILSHSSFICGSSANITHGCPGRTCYTSGLWTSRRIITRIKCQAIASEDLTHIVP